MFLKNGKYILCFKRLSHLSELLLFKQIRITNAAYLSSSENKQKSLLNIIVNRINATGPITIAEYMKESLTNSLHGYYMHKDVFGKRGDFITSPEICQIFGELIGIWFIHELMKSGYSGRINIVEFGPGRGTLADDLLRTFSKFPNLSKNISFGLIEISPKMKEIQFLKLCKQGVKFSSNLKTFTKYGIPIFWYDDISCLPKEFTCFIAHEFFDALPIHSFIMDDKRNSWNEILISISKCNDLEFIQSKTNNSMLFNLDEYSNGRKQFEFSPQTGIILQNVGEMLKNFGGFGLIVDYGHMGIKENTFRGFSDHKIIDPLKKPGNSDLTADVDFLYVRKQLNKYASVHGPITQRTFLHKMGIDVRLKMLLQKASNEQQKNLISGYKMLTDKNDMGAKFHFMSFSSLKTFFVNHVPAAFD